VKWDPQVPPGLRDPPDQPDLQDLLDKPDLPELPDPSARQA
jgi:hypothetical protein